MASRFWIGGGTNTNWSANPTTNWAATSGGTTRVAAPSTSDDVTFDGAGANGNTASSLTGSITVLSLTITSGYTQTLTFTAQLTVTVSFTDSNNAHTWAGNGTLRPQGNVAITSNGKTTGVAVVFDSTGGSTKTITGTWSIAGSVTMTGILTLNGGDVNMGASFTHSANTSGTSKIVFNGTGTWSGTGTLTNNVDVNTAGTLTIGTIAYNTGTITYVAGTVSVTNGTTMTVAASTTFNTAGISWYNITLSATATITINSVLTVTNQLGISSGQTLTFAGTAGFTVATFQVNTSSGLTHTFKNAVTYTITTEFNASFNRVGTITLLTSDHATIKAIFILQQGASCNCIADFRRIDASGGRTIWTFNGTITDCLNIRSFTDIPTAAYAA